MSDFHKGMPPLQRPPPPPSLSVRHSNNIYDIITPDEALKELISLSVPLAHYLESIMLIQ